MRITSSITLFSVFFICLNSAYSHEEFVNRYYVNLEPGGISYFHSPRPFYFFQDGIAQHSNVQVTYNPSITAGLSMSIIKDWLTIFPDITYRYEANWGYEQNKSGEMELLKYSAHNISPKLLVGIPFSKVKLVSNYQNWDLPSENLGSQFVEKRWSYHYLLAGFITDLYFNVDDEDDEVYKYMAVFGYRYCQTYSMSSMFLESGFELRLGGSENSFSWGMEGIFKIGLRNVGLSVSVLINDDRIGGLLGLYAQLLDP